MREKAKTTIEKHTGRGRVWLWLVCVLLVVCGAIVWVLYDGGVIYNRAVETGGFVDAPVVVDQKTKADVAVAETPEQTIKQPACEVIEDILLVSIADDYNRDYRVQEAAAQTYSVLAQYGCPENAQYFVDMAARKQTIADGLAAAWGRADTTKRSMEYLYSDEKICETIEKRVMQNINTDAYSYSDFLNNANTYAVLYEYGCDSNKVAYMRAAIRELGVAVALMPTDKMPRDKIIMVVEICKSLGVAQAAHLMLQRLKARGYDMEFLLEMEDIIHSIR